MQEACFRMAVYLIIFKIRWCPCFSSKGIHNYKVLGHQLFKNKLTELQSPRILLSKNYTIWHKLNKTVEPLAEL